MTREPVASIAFVLPLLLIYEVGVIVLGRGDPDLARAGVDYWLRSGLGRLGLADRGLPPLAVLGGLLAWQAFPARGYRTRIQPSCLLGMAIESLILAIVLMGLARLVDLGLARLDESPIWLAASELEDGNPFAPRMLRFLGAGIYEEAVFRLALLPICFGALRILLVPEIPAGALALTISALAFALAHHAGTVGEPFAFYPFFFRWAAGLYFAWIFEVRGFGVAVGAHAAYDGLANLIEPF